MEVSALFSSSPLRLFKRFIIWGAVKGNSGFTKALYYSKDLSTPFYGSRLLCCLS
jgi:hypothetical protein